MAITNGYTTLAKLKRQLNIDDGAEDQALEALVEAVSRAIDDYCGRRFYAVTQTRYYTPRYARCLLVDDLLSVTTLKTDDDGDGTFETTWATSDYLLAPYNAQQETPPRPYSLVETAPSGDYWFPVGRQRGVEIAGSWGFSASTPDSIEAACLFQAAYEHRSSYAPLGISGSDTVGLSDHFRNDVRLTGLHPIARRRLDTYRLVPVG